MFFILSKTNPTFQATFHLSSEKAFYTNKSKNFVVCHRINQLERKVSFSLEPNWSNNSNLLCKMEAIAVFIKSKSITRQSPNISQRSRKCYERNIVRHSEAPRCSRLPTNISHIDLLRMGKSMNNEFGYKIRFFLLRI